MKKCTKCNILKGFEEFHKSKHHKDGYYSICKECKRNSLASSVAQQMITGARNRSRYKDLEFDLTIDFIYFLKKKQNNKCALTGKEMKWERNNTRTSRVTQDIASLDRINSKGGYTKDNVQLVCCYANNKKKQKSIEELLEFCWAVINKHTQA